MSKKKSTYKEFMDTIYAIRAREGRKIYESLEKEFSKGGKNKTQ